MSRRPFAVLCQKRCGDRRRYSLLACRRRLVVCRRFSLLVCQRRDGGHHSASLVYRSSLSDHRRSFLLAWQGMSSPSTGYQRMRRVCHRFSLTACQRMRQAYYQTDPTVSPKPTEIRHHLMFVEIAFQACRKSGAVRLVPYHWIFQLIPPRSFDHDHRYYRTSLTLMLAQHFAVLVVQRIYQACHRFHQMV